MPNIMEAGASWIGQQLKSHAGLACNYFHGLEVLPLTLVPIRSDASNDRKAMLGERGIAARTQDFGAIASELLVGSEYFLPTPGDSIEWTDPTDEFRTSVVFPLADQNCFRWSDPSKTRLRIYTVDIESLVNVRIAPVGTPPFDVLGLPTVVRGEELFVDMGQTVRLLRTAIYLPRSVFEEVGIIAPPLNAMIDTLGGIWSVMMNDTEWGEGLVKLALEQEAMSREYQARRHAAV